MRHPPRNQTIHLTGYVSAINAFDILEDLWTQLEVVSRKPIGNMMSTWTTQMGFPVISVSRESVSINLLFWVWLLALFNTMTVGYRMQFAYLLSHLHYPKY